jgi:type II secretory pathway pseudopilin PulG
MKPVRQSALSLWEVLAALVIMIGLAYLALPFVVGAYAHDGRTRSLSNMRQLQMATRQMAIDNGQTLEAGWPGDTDGTFFTWSRNLVEGGYFTISDFRKLLSANGRMIRACYGLS